MVEIDGVQLPFMPAGGVQELKRQTARPGHHQPANSFDEIFKDELSKLKFSGHAQTRMISREITLNENEVERLQNAVSKAEDKGANESLILFQDKAFIVSIPNRTVITAVNKEQLEANVVTNIDSAVFA